VECVSPRLLNPLKRSASCPTPKSAMKSKYVFCFSCMLGQGPLLSSSNQSRQGPPLSSSSQARTGFLNRQGWRRKSLVFSPYNGVKIIPHRTDPDAASSPKPWECL
jgi:hypothetical protein